MGIFVAMAALGSAPSLAAILTGTVRVSGSPIDGVNIDVVDADTGDDIPLMNDSTDINGVFSVVVPDSATYDVLLQAPIDSRAVSTVVESVVVGTGTTDIGIVALEPGALLTGTVVRSDDLLPVLGVDTDVDISSSGERVFTPADNTDASGVFEVIVPLTTIDLTIEPKKIDKLVARSIAGIAIAADTDLGMIQVDPGALLTGVVTRASDGSFVEDADTDVFDSSTGDKIPTPGDNTDEFGVFSIVVPIGTIDIAFKPMKADRLVATTVTAITVAGDMNLGTTSLNAGALLSGTVVRASGGAAVTGADTDTHDAFSGQSILTPGDDTDATGGFSVVVPFGTFEFTIEPDVIDRLVALRFADLDVTADTDLGVLALEDGFLITGTVHDPSGVVADNTVAAYDDSTGERVPTPGSRSDAAGNFAFVLPAGTFDVKWAPPLGDGTGRLFSENFIVAGDVAVDPMLTGSTASVSIGGTGHLVLGGNRYEPEVSVINNSGSSLSVKAILQAEVPSRGIVKNAQPPITKTLPGNPRVITKTIRVRIPDDLGPALLGIPIHLVVRLVDPSDDSIFDEDRIEFRVR